MLFDVKSRDVQQQLYFKTGQGDLLQLLSDAIISNQPIFYHLEFT
jgi:hypothetical protein